MKREYSRTELENIFANDFSSPAFPILANLYYKNKEYDRANKVCKIGLEHNPRNLIGQFILAKLYLIENKKKSAEKLLKNIIIFDPGNIQALLMLINISIDLKRSKKTINNLVVQANSILPNNQVIKKLFSKYSSTHKNKPAKQSRKTANKKDKSAVPSINKEMATQTMYKMMLSQKKYKIACEILNVMKKKNKKKKFVTTEMKKIKKYLEKGSK